MVRLPAADASNFPAQNYGGQTQTRTQAGAGAGAGVGGAFESKIEHIRKMFEADRRFLPRIDSKAVSLGSAQFGSLRCQIKDDI